MRRGRWVSASAPVQADWLDAKLAGAIGLVSVSVLDDDFGLAAVDEEIDGLVEGVIHDAKKPEAQRHQ